MGSQKWKQNLKDTVDRDASLKNLCNICLDIVICQILEGEKSCLTFRILGILAIGKLNNRLTRCSITSAGCNSSQCKESTDGKAFLANSQQPPNLNTPSKVSHLK